MSFLSALSRQLLSAAISTGHQPGLAPGDPEAIDIALGEECILRVQSEVRKTGAARAWSAELALAYPGVMPLYDKLWAVSGRNAGDMHFPLTCRLDNREVASRVLLRIDDGEESARVLAYRRFVESLASAAPVAGPPAERPRPTRFPRQL